MQSMNKFEILERMISILKEQFTNYKFEADSSGNQDENIIRVYNGKSKIIFKIEDEFFDDYKTDDNRNIFFNNCISFIQSKLITIKNFNNDKLLVQWE